MGKSLINKQCGSMAAWSNYKHLEILDIWKDNLPEFNSIGHFMYGKIRGELARSKNNWDFVLVTWDGKQIELLINGVSLLKGLYN